VTYVEEMVLRRPPPSIPTVHREASELAVVKGWTAPSYATVYDIAQIARILDVNEMDVVTKDVVEAARGSLIIGPP
jgi:hypothetical protein